MALTTCKECGGKMSDRATECPHCGCPREFQDEIHPIDNSSTQSQKPLSEQIQPNPKKTHKGLWISIAAILFVALSLGVVLFFGWGKTLDGTQTLKITPEFTKALQRYDQIDAFSEGMAAVRRDGKWGYINLQGEEVIPCQFSDAFPPGQFSEGLACVVDERSEEDKKLWNRRVGFINKRGEFVITGDYFTEAPTLGTVWNDESHMLPSFKDGKCSVWNTAVYSLNDENSESGWSKEYEANDVVLIDSKGKISELTDSTAYQIGDFHPYVIPTPYRGVIKPTETKVVFDDYAINIARDTVNCDNGAKLVTWQIIDANSYPYGGYGGTYEKTCQYYIDHYGNSTLTPEQEKSMEQHLNGLVTLISKKHKEQELQIAREEWEQSRREEEAQKRQESAVDVAEPVNTSYNSSNSSSDKERRILLRLSKLNEEGKKLISEMYDYRSRGQLDPLNLMYYKRACLSIKDQQIDLARQLDDLNLVIEYQKQRQQIETAFRAMEY